MKVTNQTRSWLIRLHDGKNYIVQNRIVVAILLFNFFATIVLVMAMLSLVRGNLPLKGLLLTGAIKSTAEHEHSSYDNIFVTGLDKTGSVMGSSLQAVNIRATGGAIVGWYFINEGVLYQGGGISFGKAVYSGKEKYPLGLFQFESKNMDILPDYKNKRIKIMGAYFDETGLTGISDKEVQRIKKEVITELKELKGNVICGN